MGFSFKHESVAADVTREFDLGVSSEPGGPQITLIVRHAGESNRPYWNAMFKAGNAARGRAQSSQVSPEQVTKGRLEMVSRYATHVICGWRNVTDGGKPVDYSSDKAEELLLALLAPDVNRTDVFDALAAFCKDAGNFSAPVVGATELGKR